MRLLFRAAIGAAKLNENCVCVIRKFIRTIAIRTPPPSGFVVGKLIHSVLRPTVLSGRTTVDVALKQVIPTFGLSIKRTDSAQKYIWMISFAYQPRLGTHLNKQQLTDSLWPHTHAQKIVKCDDFCLPARKKRKRKEIALKMCFCCRVGAF